MQISATIITKDEEKTLPNCIHTLRDLVDEIIVVDSGSNDQTADIARSLAAKVVANNFENFSKQKNFAASLAQHSWILNLDADELLSDELWARIRKIKEEGTPAYQAFCFPRKTYGPDGKMLFNIISYPGFHYRLYHKEFCSWRNPVHETLEVRGRRKFYPEHILHYPNYSRVPQKEELYKRLKQEFTGEQRQFSLAESLSNFWFHFRALFIDLGFYKKGWLYWKHGFHVLYHLAGLRLKQRSGA
jgi:glycosyltransferase involved in cell wall biosynthesis